MGSKTGSAIDAAAKPRDPVPAKAEGLNLWQAWQAMKRGEKVSRRSGDEGTPWPYFLSYMAYMVIVGNRIDIVSGDGSRILAFDYKLGFEDLNANNFFILKDL